MKKAVIAIVETDAQAQSIVNELGGAGFRSSGISVLSPDRDGTQAFAHEHHTKAPEGAVAGAGAGGEERLRKGNLLVSVHTDNSDQQRLAQDIFQRNGAKDVTTKSEAAVPGERGT